MHDFWNRSSIPRFRHIIVHIEDGQTLFSRRHPDALSTNPLTYNVETTGFLGCTDVIQIYSSEFNHLDPADLDSHLAESVSDIVILDSWPSGTQPIVWIAPYSRQECYHAEMIIEMLRREFSDEALDIVLVVESVGGIRSKHREPEWLRRAWANIGHFAYCGTAKAVFSVLLHATQDGASERPMTHSQGQHRLSAVREPRRPDIVRHGGGGCSFVKHAAEHVDTIRFYDREKPWYEFTNFFQGAGFFWEPSLERFSTVEHFFQAMKTMDPTERVKITLAVSARDAFNIARNSTGTKWYWEQQCLCGDLFKERNEASRVDSYWGSGDNGKGKNRLGFLLEKVRAAILREECLRRQGHGYFESKFQELWH
ncbi:hypothetical protein BGZ74_011575 [Mortierella antarctica]|nr:hypothetical protein BGZ74_011575 [Mortierella antarctica]